jgi:hypothetical protein
MRNDERTEHFERTNDTIENAKHYKHNDRRYNRLRV